MLKLIWDQQRKVIKGGLHADRSRYKGDSPGHLADQACSRAALQGAPPVIGVLGAKGGVGATTTAINLALALAELPGSTALVDANLQQPDAATMLARDPRFTLLDILLRHSLPDKAVFDACCMDLGELNTDCLLLSPPLNGEAQVRSNLTQVAACLENVRGFADRWVFDLPGHLDRHLVTLMDSCNRILLLFEASFTGVAAAKRWLQVLADLEYPEDKVICVLSRAGSRSTDLESQILACFGGQIVFKLPNASKVAERSSLCGQPIITAFPNHAYSKAIRKLACQAIEGVQRAEGEDAHLLPPNSNR